MATRMAAWCLRVESSADGVGHVATHLFSPLYLVVALSEPIVFSCPPSSSQALLPRSAPTAEASQSGREQPERVSVCCRARGRHFAMRTPYCPCWFSAAPASPSWLDDQSTTVRPPVLFVGGRLRRRYHRPLNRFQRAPSCVHQARHLPGCGDCRSDHHGALKA